MGDPRASQSAYMPRAQAEAAKVLLARLEAAQLESLGIDDSRLQGAETFKQEVEATIQRRVCGGLARMNDGLDTGYFGQVREEAGMMHYPDGSEIYAALVRLHGSTEMSSAEVHEMGLERMAKVREGMHLWVERPHTHSTLMTILRLQSHMRRLS